MSSTNILGLMKSQTKLLSLDRGDIMSTIKEKTVSFCEPSEEDSVLKAESLVKWKDSRMELVAFVCCVLGALKGKYFCHQ